MIAGYEVVSQCPGGKMEVKIVTVDAGWERHDLRLGGKPLTITEPILDRGTVD